MLYWMQQTGHRPIALMGGGTTRVGDPSGKDESRKILTDDDNQSSSCRHPCGLFKNSSSSEAGPPIHHGQQCDWLNSLNYIDFLRDVGRHFSINRMLAFDSVKMRSSANRNSHSFEFNYMILQAYDFVELNKRHGCVLQMGGSDQWENIHSAASISDAACAMRSSSPLPLLSYDVVGRQDG